MPAQLGGGGDHRAQVGEAAPVASPRTNAENAVISGSCSKPDHDLGTSGPKFSMLLISLIIAHALGLSPGPSLWLSSLLRDKRIGYQGTHCEHEVIKMSTWTIQALRYDSASKTACVRVGASPIGLQIDFPFEPSPGQCASTLDAALVARAKQLINEALPTLS